MRIAIGSDHRGFALKQRVKDLLKDGGYQTEDFGSFDNKQAEYPNIARAVGEAVAAGKFERGILICGTGIGMCIAANKVKGIRAAVGYNTFIACRMRQHNDANVLCLGGENDATALPEILKMFLTCQFEGGRHQDRVHIIEEIEKSG